VCVYGFFEYLFQFYEAKKLNCIRIRIRIHIRIMKKFGHSSSRLHSRPPFIEKCLLQKKHSSFPIKDDAGYIGYLTDSDSGNRVTALSRIVRDRRRELLGSDCDFTMTFFVMVIAVMAVATIVVIGSAIIKR
jgi:hypothetical protein